jgi:glycosyltransferase involved in cell wall biosynthesis
MRGNVDGEMTFGFDALRLSGQRFGIGRYIEYVLKHWDTMLESGERVVVYVREPWDKSSLGLSDAFDVRVLPSRLKGVWWESFVLSRHWRETDVLFCPSYTIPLTYRGKTVVATHSVNEIQSGAHTRWYDLTWRQRNKRSARSADAVIVPSESARRHVVELYGVPAKRVYVVPEGVDDAFRPVEDASLLSATRRRFFGDERPYVLFVGKFSQRRNIPTLIQAFAQAKRQDGLPHGLLLYGANVHDLPLDRIAAEAGVSDSVVMINEQLADHRDIIPVYSAADLYAFPSAYEGFSLTVCEAMACGTPVVTVNRGAVAEIVDGAALTIEEPTVEQLADAMERVLSDPDLKSQLRTKAIERSKLFRFSDCARGTLDVLREVAAT